MDGVPDLRDQMSYILFIPVRYLKARQAEWAEAAADALASIPDPDCPPGHLRLEDEVRTSLVTSLTSRHAALLQEWNR